MGLKREAKSGEKRLMFLFGPLFSVLQSPLMKKDETCDSRLTMEVKNVNLGVSGSQDAL